MHRAFRKNILCSETNVYIQSYVVNNISSVVNNISSVVNNISNVVNKMYTQRIQYRVLVNKHVHIL